MTFEPLVRNRAIEDAAMAYVMEIERQDGREPVDRRFDAAFAADISSPPRTIEVKAVGKDQRGWFVPIETRQYDAARSDPDFYLYVVDNIRQGDPSAFRLKVFGGDQLERLLAKAKKREYWEVPIPVAEFDAAPGREAVTSADRAVDVRISEQRLTEFTEAMVGTYRNAKVRAGYDAKIFIGMVGERGGLATAQYLIRSDRPSDGYTALYERGRLDLTVEALVVSGEWDDLFPEEDRTRARDRLRAYGYDVSG
jgi:hypothetical protein